MRRVAWIRPVELPDQFVHFRLIVVVVDGVVDVRQREVRLSQRRVHRPVGDVNIQLTQP